MPRDPNIIDPDADNAEQADDDQAQDVAQDALDGDDPSEDSERGRHSNRGAVMPDDVPDLVEKMEEMITSGRIDNGAFAGEPMHDDEEDIRGLTDSDEDDQ